MRATPPGSTVFHAAVREYAATEMEFDASGFPMPQRKTDFNERARLRLK